MPGRRHGFTLVELLVVVAIIALLIGILVPTLGAVRKQARKVIELSAVRNLMLGHAMYAQEHRGVLIPGYDIKASANGPEGEPLNFPETARYPWRLVPYLDKSIEQTILVHQRLDEVDKDGQINTYGASVRPSFGINGEFVGGTWGGPYNGWLRGFDVTVRKTAQAKRPLDLIVFASARGGVTGNDRQFGHHLVQPAYGNDYNQSDMPSKFGNVHPRYDGQAVVGFLDGHADGLKVDQLQDMRKWSDAAARSGNPNWTLEDAISE